MGAPRSFSIQLGPVVLSAWLWAGGCSAPTPEAAEDRQTPATGRVAAALVARNDSILVAVRRGDADAAARFYAPDGLLLPPDGSVVRGRAAIRSFWAAGAGFDSVATDLIAIERDGTLASHTGRYVIWTTVGYGKSEATEGIFLIVWQKDADGEWRVQADMWN